MSDTQPDDEVMISIGDLQDLTKYSAMFPPNERFLQLLDSQINKNFKDLPIFNETPLHVVDAGMVQLYVKHLQSTCHGKFEDHTFRDDVYKQIDRWQDTRIFSICDEEKIPYKNARRIDMNELADAMAERTQLIHQALEPTELETPAEDSEEKLLSPKSLESEETFSTPARGGVVITPTIRPLAHHTIHQVIKPKESYRLSLQPGFFIHDGVQGNNAVINVSSLLRSVFHMENLEEARTVLSSLPTTIPFEDIMEWEKAYCISKNIKYNFSLDQAIERANELVSQFETYKIKAEVILPQDVDADATEINEYVQMIKAGGTIMFYGPTGVGKTAKAREACKRAGLKKIAYYSLPTLAPEDFAGIPSPDPNNDKLFHYRMLNTNTDCEAMILDETNRAHPKILNAIMQLMLERKINDMEFPHLKAIVLCINPPDAGDYIGTEELDEAVRERVDYFVEVANRPNAAIIARLLFEDPHLDKSFEECQDVASIVVEWFDDLDDKRKSALNARRLQKLATAWLHGIDLHKAVDKKGNGAGVTVQDLIKRLKSIATLSLKTLIDDTDAVEEVLKSGTQLAADYEYRYVELVKMMHRRGLHREIVKVGHLFNYVGKDKLPKPDRDRSWWGFITKAYKKHATPEQAKQFQDVMKARVDGNNAIKSQLKKIGELASVPDAEAVAI